MPYEKVSTLKSNMWNFDENPELEGEFVEVKHEVGPNKSNVYKVRLDNGEEVEFWGTTVLDSQMSALEPGQNIRVAYLGKAKGKRGSYRNFSVERWIDESELPPRAEKPTDDGGLDPKDIPF